MSVNMLSFTTFFLSLCLTFSQLFVKSNDLSIGKKTKHTHKCIFEFLNTEKCAQKEVIICVYIISSYKLCVNYVCVTAQNEVAGKGVGISDELITLQVMSPDVCDLTLIDLPGIARVPLKGQPEDIGEQVGSTI